MENYGLNLKTTNRSQVEEVPYGLYVWRLSTGEVAGDGDGNFMNVFCLKGDQKAIAALTESARHYGFGDGKPEWWSGKRRITDDELAEQEARERLGLEPDPLNVGAIRDTVRGQRND